MITIAEELRFLAASVAVLHPVTSNRLGALALQVEALETLADDIAVQACQEAQEAEARRLACAGGNVVWLRDVRRARA